MALTCSMLEKRYIDYCKAQRSPPRKDILSALHKLVENRAHLMCLIGHLERVSYDGIQLQCCTKHPHVSTPTQFKQGRGGVGGGLKSRGLCLVPVSSTAHVESSTNGAYIWSTAALASINDKNSSNIIGKNGFNVAQNKP